MKCSNIPSGLGNERQEENLARNCQRRYAADKSEVSVIISCEAKAVERFFCSAYGKARASLISNDIYKRQAVFKVLCNSISILDYHYDPAKCEELSPVIEQIVGEVVDIIGSGFIYTETTDSDGFKSDDKSKTYTLFVGLATEMQKTLNNIANKIPVGHKDALLVIRKGQLELANIMSANDHHIGLAMQSKIDNCRIGITIVQKIKELDPSFVSPVDFDRRLEIMEKVEKDSKVIEKAVAIIMPILMVLLFIWLGYMFFK